MMGLSKEERIDLALLSGREGWSRRQIAEEFSLRHPYRQRICFFTAYAHFMTTPQWHGRGAKFFNFLAYVRA